ncbi:MAG: hypothetical protein PHC94_08160 [Methylobacter sp.]|jgi:hypothetical protein|nr:hypothetical protein [Methylobacter sp.]
MNKPPTDVDSTTVKAKKSAPRKGKSTKMLPATNGEILVKGVVMGIIISGITHASKSLTGALIKHPLSFFSMGLVTGYLTHKYRKEIIVVGNRTAEEGKNFVLRQKEYLIDFVEEIKEERSDKSK